MYCKIVLWVLVCKAMIVLSVPEATLNMRNAADRFQNSVQQQTFQSVLLAIEERLRNLDNIYSMQLSETLKSKMDLYNRKLDSLDTKIIRLESVVMLNLDKISENISTKNYKDDLARSQSYRKMENVYDGLTHRINYMDRKFELAFEKIQNKVDSTLQRLERMEEDMIQRNADIESELSETLSILEDYKTSTSNTELVLLNMTNLVKETLSNEPMIQALNYTIIQMMQNINESVTRRFDSLENTTLKTLNISGQSTTVLNSMKVEMKEDFNEYANKVADMNVDIWKRNDIAEESLKTIETVTNSTRTEVQNGVRSLMLQIGKLSGKGIMNNDKTSLESLKNSVNLSMEKIITNQELFLESCHRVQMDESQIESEISDMLGKLIDMLETKMTTVMKDLKGIEKSVKNHDSRIHRNLNQANTNIISLFEKTTRANDFAEKELQDIKFYINSLFTFIQDVLPRTKGINDTEGLLNDISLNISNLIWLINSSNTNTTIKWNQLESNFSKNKVANDKFVDQIKNAINMLSNNEIKHHINSTENINRSLLEIRKMILDLHKTLQNLNVTDTSTVWDYKLKKLVQSGFNTTDYEGRESIISVDIIGESKTNDTMSHTNEKRCNQNYRNLIDIRTGGEPCDDSRGIETSNNNNKSHTNVQVESDQGLEKTILNVFGTPPSPSTTTEKMMNQPNEKRCNQNYRNLIDIRTGVEPCDNSTGIETGNNNNKSHTNVQVESDQGLEKTILNVFGTPPSPSTTEKVKNQPNEKRCNQNYRNLIDIRTGVEPCDNSTGIETSNNNNKSHTNVQVESDHSLEKTILNVFGTPPSPSTTTQKMKNQPKVASNKKKCPPNWANLINVRYGNNDNCTDFKTKKAKLKRRRMMPKLASRFNDGSLIDEQSQEDTDYDESDLIESTTDITTEMPSTESPESLNE